MLFDGAAEGFSKLTRVILDNIHGTEGSRRLQGNNDLSKMSTIYLQNYDVRKPYCSFNKS